MQPGQRVKHYEILDNVGRGGMGVVYRARDTKLDRIVALKFLTAGAQLDPRSKQRFVQEARAASSLDHPNICTIHDIDETEDGLLYIVMGYYEGRTLAERMRDESFSVDRTARIGRRLAAALGRAHAAGIVHRDLKPANVMLLEGDEVKLLDFGVVKLTEGEDVTATHGTVGTIAYMSPEQLRGEAVDGRTDIWALGTVLHEMLCGTRPFEGTTSASLITAILQNEPEPPAQRRPDLPEELTALLAACLRKDRDERPPDAESIERRLAAILGESSAAASEATRTTQSAAAPAAGSAASAPRRRRWALVAVGLAAAALVATVWTVSRNEREPVTTASASAVAVMPFAVRGDPDLAYLGEGMVDLISVRLDGIGDLTTIDPRIVLARIRARGADLAAAGTAEAIARDLGAGRYLSGDVLEVGGRVTLTASLHLTGDGETPPLRAIAEGDSGDLFAMIDRLVADLVTSGGDSSSDRLGRIAARSSRSLDATKAFLRGESAARSGDFRDAAAAYDEAIAHDPEFALAHYRKSVVSEWIDEPDVRSSCERARELADGLPPRERALVEALALRRAGRNHEAEQAYRAILHRDPNDLDALIQLGEVHFHDNPRVGRDMFESRTSFQRILELDTEHAAARIHLARLQAIEGDLDSLKTNGDHFTRENPDGERAMEIASLVAFLTGDVAAQDEVVARLATAPAPHVFYSAHGLARFGHSVEGARRVLEAAGSDEPFLLVVQASLYLEEGRLSEFLRFLDGIPRSDDAGWVLYRAFVLTSGSVPATQNELSDLLDRVRALTPEAVLESSWLPPSEDMTSEFFRFEIDYYIALLAIHSGRLDEAREVMRRMTAVPPLAGLGSGQADALRGLQAEIEWRTGNDEAALRALRSIEYEVPHAFSVRSFVDGARNRFLRAELERSIGDSQTAKGFYEGLDRSWSWWDTGFRPSVYWGLAQIAESEGRIDDAIEYYRRLLDLWRNCDPVLQEQRDEVVHALDLLSD